MATGNKYRSVNWKSSNVVSSLWNSPNHLVPAREVNNVVTVCEASAPAWAYLKFTRPTLVLSVGSAGEEQRWLTKPETFTTWMWIWHTSLCLSPVNPAYVGKRISKWFVCSCFVRPTVWVWDLCCSQIRAELEKTAVTVLLLSLAGSCSHISYTWSCLCSWTQTQFLSTVSHSVIESFKRLDLRNLLRTVLVRNHSTSASLQGAKSHLTCLFPDARTSSVAFCFCAVQ